MTRRGVVKVVLVMFVMTAACVSVLGQATKPSNAASSGAGRGEESPATAAERLADQLKKHPANPSRIEFRRGLYLMDLAQGDVTMIADEPDPGADSCGSPRWSHDGRRILFDVMPNMGSTPQRYEMSHRNLTKSL
jgi:hypothetical protein